MSRTHLKFPYNVTRTVFTFAFFGEDNPECEGVFYVTDIFKSLEFQQLQVEFIYNWTKLAAE